MAAVILLPIGALLIPLLWLVGAAMLWLSHVWTLPEKLLGTVLTALGVLWAPVLFVFFSGNDICTTRLNASGEEAASGRGPPTPWCPRPGQLGGT
jgi:hypothetical protein